MIIAPIAAALALSAPSGAAGQSATPVPLPGQISSTGSPLEFHPSADSPVLSYDPVSRRVLALWMVDRNSPAVFGRVLDARGRAVGAQFALPGFEAVATALAVAARPRAGGWVVGAGVKDATGARQIVTRTIAPTGEAWGISAPAVVGVTDATPVSPQIAFDARTGRGVIGWFGTADHGPGGIYARSIDAAGRPAGPVRTIFRPAKSTSSEGSLALGFSTRTHRWLAVWKHATYSPPKPVTNVYARRVLRDGRPRGPIHALGRAADFRNASLYAYDAPTLVTNTGSAHSLVLYTVASLNPERTKRLQVVRLDADGAAVSHAARTLRVFRGRDTPSSPSVVRVSRHALLLTYVRACDPDRDRHVGCPRFAPVFARPLTGSGVPTGPSRVLVATAVGSVASTVATGPRTALLAGAGPTLWGPPIADASAMERVIPSKREIFVRSLTLPAGDAWVRIWGDHPRQGIHNGSPPGRCCAPR